MNASLILLEMANWNGDARLYKVEPAFDGHHYVVVELWPAAEGFADEAHVYASTPNGGAVAHPGGGLSPQRRFHSRMTHEETLAEIGYEVTP